MLKMTSLLNRFLKKENTVYLENGELYVRYKKSKLIEYIEKHMNVMQENDNGILIYLTRDVSIYDSNYYKLGKGSHNGFIGALYVYIAGDIFKNMLYMGTQNIYFINLVYDKKLNHKQIFSEWLVKNRKEFYKKIIGQPFGKLND